MKRIAILGGGIAGLTAAYELARIGTGLEVRLFEASSRVGGIIETVREAGFTIECGPDGWVTEKPWARVLAHELGLDDEILPSNDATRRTYVLIDGKLRPMPQGMRMMVPASEEALESLDASALFSPAAKRAFHEELLRSRELKLSHPEHDESVASFVERHFGEEVLEKLGAPLLSGVFGGDVRTLSVRAVMAPFVAMERDHGSLIHALLSRPAAINPPAIFTSLRTGMGTLVDRLVAAVPEGWMRLNETVIGLSREEDGCWRVRTSVGEESFDAVLMALPVHLAQRLLQPVDGRAAELMEVDSSSAIVVALAYAAPAEGELSELHIPPGFGFLVPPTPELSLMACTFVDGKYAHRVPPGGRLLRAFFGSEVAIRLAHETDEQLVELAKQDLAAILGPMPEPSFAVVRRWPLSLPQYSVGHLERMAELNARVRELAGLALLGNGYRGVGLPDLIRDARAAAIEVAGH